MHGCLFFRRELTDVRIERVAYQVLEASNAHVERIFSARMYVPSCFSRAIYSRASKCLFSANRIIIPRERSKARTCVSARKARSAAFRFNGNLIRAEA